MALPGRTMAAMAMGPGAPAGRAAGEESICKQRRSTEQDQTKSGGRGGETMAEQL